MKTFTWALMAAGAFAVVAFSGTAHAANYYYTPTYSAPAPAMSAIQSSYVRVRTPTGYSLVPRQTNYPGTPACPTGTCPLVNPTGSPQYQTLPNNQGYGIVKPSPPVYRPAPSTSPTLPAYNNDSPFYDGSPFNAVPSPDWNNGFNMPAGQISKPMVPFGQPSSQNQPVLDSPFYP